MNKKASKLGKNTALMFVGNFASRLLLFFLVPLYTYCLSTDEYGVSDLIFTTVQLLIPLLTLVASEALIRFTLDKDSNKSHIFTVSSLIFGIGFLLLLITSPFIYRYTPFSEYYCYFLAYYFVSAISLNIQQFLKGLERIGTFVISGIINTFVTIVANIIFLVILHTGISGYLIALIIGSAVSIVFSIIKEKLWRYITRISNVDKRVWQSYLLFCLPLLPNSISWWISNSSDKYILQFFWGASLTGIYAVSYKIPSIITTLSSIFTSAWQISAVDDFGSDESVKFISNVYNKYSSFYFISSSVIVLAVQPLSSILFAKEYYSAWSYSVLLIYASIFQSLAAFIGVIYTTAKKTKMIFITTMAGAIGNIILNVILIPQFGAFGAAIATLLSYIIVWFIRLIDSRRIIRLTMEIKRDVICYLLLIVQGIITCLNIKYYFVISFFIVAFELWLNKQICLEMITLIKRKLIK